MADNFDPSVHPWSCRVWDHNDERWTATNRMQWYIGKGQTVSSESPILFDFYRTFSKGERKVCTEQLIVCDQNTAPAGFEAQPGSPTRVLCNLKVDLKKIPGRFWTKHETSNGKQYNRIEYQLGMQIQSGTIKFDIRVEDVVYGNVTASFDAD